MGFQLNKYQKEAVTHIDGPCLVTANPGSGKTRVIVERIVRLIREENVLPKNIVCLTFTNRAALEAKNRICKNLGSKDPGFFIGTFHSLCAKILRKIGPGKGYSTSFSILDDRDQIDAIMQVSRYLGYNIKSGDARQIGYILNFYRDQIKEFDWVEDNLKTPSMVEIAQEYMDRCKNNNMIDFSGLISETIRIIEEDMELREKIQRSFNYVIVDEVQDTCPSQFQLITLLGDKWKNIMIVGDHNQSIYKFRGARYQNIQDFVDKYDNCKVIQLPQNYRSTPEIINTASKLIKHNSNNENFEMITDNKKGNPVKCYSFKDQNKEAEWVVGMIKKIVEQKGWSYSDIACVYRVNKMSQPLEQSLTNLGIPYKVFNSYSFYDRVECRDSLSMLKLLSNKKDSISFSRVAGLFKGMGNITIGKIEKKAIKNDISLIDACLEFKKESNSVASQNTCQKIYDIYNKNYDFSNPAKCLNDITEQIDYKKYLNNKYGEESEERIENVGQIVDSCGEFEGQEGGLYKYLQNVSLVTDKENDKENKNKVSLLSIHSAKGTEYEIVFLVGCEQGITPHQLACKEDYIEGISEERRIFFVAMSRAKQMLWLTYCKNRKGFGKYGKMIYRKAKPSQFLYECELLKEK